MQVLTMAPGWQWSRTVAFPTSGPDGAPVVYQKGFGTTRADHEWYCSWENRLVTPGLTEVDYARARAELAKVRTKHMYRFDILPVDRPLFNRILNSALKGKLSLMRRDVALNCSSGRAAL